MESTTVRVSKKTHQAVRNLADQRQVSQGELIAEAVDNLRRQSLLEQTNAAYAQLRDDQEEWQEEQEDRQAWDATLSDGVRQ